MKESNICLVYLIPELNVMAHKNGVFYV